MIEDQKLSVHSFKKKEAKQRRSENITSFRSAFGLSIQISIKYKKT